jgi:hypothetical protein
MYRGLGDAWEDLWDFSDESIEVDHPPVDNYSPPTEIWPPQATAPAEITATVTDFFRHLFGGISFSATVPTAGPPGSAGCPPDKCPANQGNLVACVPCPPFGSVSPFPSPAAIAQSPWFAPAAVVGGLVLVLMLVPRGRR